MVEFDDLVPTDEISDDLLEKFGERRFNRYKTENLDSLQSYITKSIDYYQINHEDPTTKLDYYVDIIEKFKELDSPQYMVGGFFSFSSDASVWSQTTDEAGGGGGTGFLRKLLLIVLLPLLIVFYSIKGINLLVNRFIKAEEEEVDWIERAHILVAKKLCKLDVGEIETQLTVGLVTAQIALLPLPQGILTVIAIYIIRRAKGRASKYICRCENCKQHKEDTKTCERCDKFICPECHLDVHA